MVSRRRATAEADLSDVSRPPMDDDADWVIWCTVVQQRLQSKKHVIFITKIEQIFVFAQLSLYDNAISQNISL